MHIAFLNPQGNFDPNDSYWTEHPDFGGQLVYVKQVALMMGHMGHQVDVLTRQIEDPDWPEFAARLDSYPGAHNVRIVRLPAGPKRFLHKELLWPHLIRDWVPNLLAFYRSEGGLPDAMTTHYGDGGLCGALIEAETGLPFTFTAHSLGAQKMDKLHLTAENLAELDAHYHFGRRLVAERLSMNRSAVNITSSRLERFEQYGHRAYRGAVDVEDDRRIAVVRPGVDLSIFGVDARSANEEAVRRHVEERLARDIDKERRDLPAIVASSRLDPKKNHVGLVRAFAHSKPVQGHANLVLITGALDDPLREDASANATEREVVTQIRGVVKENDLWGKVTAFALPGQPALAAAYRLLARRRSVFAVTTHYEPFGLAPLEAAAAGLPVVVTRNGGPSESLLDGDYEYGVLVDPADPADIARGLERVLCDADAWERFAQRGRQRVLDRYTWERTTEGYLRLIEGILADPHARRPRQLLPIHPYFYDPRPEADVSLDELSHLYVAPRSEDEPRRFGLRLGGQ
jgi:sucrose-phosphate synthase